jgi:nucleotide-binding universal stress UspA family protein
LTQIKAGPLDRPILDGSQGIAAEERPMTYKDLLVVLDHRAAARTRIAVAVGLAERFQAHLTGLYQLALPTNPRRIGFYDYADADPLYREMRRRGESEAARVRAEFEHAAELCGIAAEWRAIDDIAEADPTVHARYADLTVLGQLDPDRGAADALQPAPQTVALGAGRPVLAVPYAGRFATVGRRVLIGWNASREATRAVNDAMPLLVTADAVTVLVIDPREGPDGHGETPGADISLHLARHGVKAEIERTVAGYIAIGDVLLSRAADLAADLLVMGAYGHSRMRELLLGGATRSILQTMTLPVLMSH